MKFSAINDGNQIVECAALGDAHTEMFRFGLVGAGVSHEES